MIKKIEAAEKNHSTDQYKGNQPESDPDQGNSSLLPEDIRILFNSTHDAISIVEYVNDGFYYIGNNDLHQKITGLNNIRGKTPQELLGEEIGGKLVKYYEKCMNTGQSVRYEQNFNFAPGNHTWHTEVTPVFGNEGIRYLLCSSKDITELKRIQDEKEMLARRLESMFYYHTAVMLIIEPESGSIVDANPAACKFYGYRKEELQSMVISDINMLPEAEIEQRRRMTCEKKQYFHIFPHRLKSGEIRLVDVYSSPIADADNTLLYSIIFDVTDRENYRTKLYQEKEVLLTTLRSIGDGVVTTDNTGLITSINQVAQDITGWSIEEAKGKHFTEVFILKNENTGNEVENIIHKVLETGRIIGLEEHTVLINKHKQPIPISDSAAPIISEEGEILGVVMVFRDISIEKKNNEKIKYLSFHDPLTDLYNRNFFDYFTKDIYHKLRYPLGIIMGDINELKLTNDIFGHAVGDDLIKTVGHIIMECSKPDHIAIRWGGDEFLVFIQAATMNKMEEITAEIEKRIGDIHSNDAIQSRISFGTAMIEDKSISLEEALKKAEEAMYQRKLLESKSLRGNMINALLTTLHEKSAETKEHTSRLTDLCVMLQDKMNYRLEEKSRLSLLCLLHDIGKIGIPDHILCNPGPLSDVQWDVMKKHSEIGYRIVSKIPELYAVAEEILHHHERWDGTGYPSGLKEEEIPLNCRILAVVDAYDAMTNDRVYRKAISKEQAFDELKKNAGTQFDPRVVELFIENFRVEETKR